MECSVERIDHLGIVAGIIKDLGIVEMINERLKADIREDISPGNIVAGMIINGLGFTSKPLSLTPIFFENKALELLFRPGVTADLFNRSKLSRILDKIYEYGCSNLFYEISSACCIQENIDMRFNSEDTTTISVEGCYDKCSDEHAIKLTHGFSKDHRVDLKQLVHELMVSQDGGVPLLMKSWNGNSNDSKIFNIRSKELIKEFSKSDSPRYLIADSKLYSKSNAINLNQLGFITRIPGTIKEEINIVKECNNNQNWLNLDLENKYQSMSITHYGINQRWIVVKSNSAKNRAEKRLSKAVENENILLKQLQKHLNKELFACEMDAKKYLMKETTQLKYHQITETTLEKVIVDEVDKYRIIFQCEKLDSIIMQEIEQHSCYTIGTNISIVDLDDISIIKAYKRQNNSVENIGFRFLKDPIFFTSSLFLKKNSRIEGLMTVMTLSLLVYSIAQRRARAELEKQNETVPNQINKPTKKPTARWIFQLMSGINLVKIKIDGKIQTVIEGMNKLKGKLAKLFGESVANIYFMHQLSC